MFKEQTMIQLQYPKSKSNRRMLKILHQAKANPGAKLHKTQWQRPSSSTHSVVENSAIHYSALFTAHPSVMHASSSIRTEGLHIPQHKLTLPRYTSKAAPTPVYTTATVTSGASITTKKAPGRGKKHMGPEARSLRNCRRPVAAAPTAPQATLRPKLRSSASATNTQRPGGSGAHSGLCRSTATIQKGTDCSVPAENAGAPPQWSVHKKYARWPHEAERLPVLLKRKAGGRAQAYRCRLVLLASSLQCVECLSQYGVVDDSAVFGAQHSHRLDGDLTREHRNAPASAFRNGLEQLNEQGLLRKQVTSVIAFANAARLGSSEEPLVDLRTGIIGHPRRLTTGDTVNHNEVRMHCGRSWDPPAEERHQETQSYKPQRCNTYQRKSGLRPGHPPYWASIALLEDNSMLACTQMQRMHRTAWFVTHDRVPRIGLTSKKRSGVLEHHSSKRILQTIHTNSLCATYTLSLGAQGGPVSPQQKQRSTNRQLHVGPPDSAVTSVENNPHDTCGVSNDLSRTLICCPLLVWKMTTEVRQPLFHYRFGLCCRHTIHGAMTALLRVRIIPSCLKRISKGPAALLYLAPLLTRVAIAIRSRAFTMDTREATEKMKTCSSIRTVDPWRLDEAHTIYSNTQHVPEEEKVKGYNRTTVETTMYPVEHSKFYSLTRYTLPPQAVVQLHRYTAPPTRQQQQQLKQNTRRAREEAHGSGSAVPAQLQEALGSSTNSAAGHASAEAAQQAPAPRTHNVPEGVGRAAVSAAAQPQSKKEQTALSLQRHPPLTKKKSKTGLICSACSLSGAIHRGRYASYSFQPHGIVCEHRVAHCTAGQKSKVRNMTEGNPWRKVPSFVAQDHDTSITAWHHFTKYRSRWCVKAGERFLPTVYCIITSIRLLSLSVASLVMFFTTSIISLVSDASSVSSKISDNKMFKEQTMIQLQYPKSKSNRRMLKILHQAKANPGAKLHKTQRQRPSSSTHSVVENSAIHYSALFTAHPSVMHASSSIRTEGLHIPQHKLTLPRYTSKAAPTPVYTTATLPPSISHMQENNKKKNDLKAIAGGKKEKRAREEAHGSGSAVPAQLQEARGSSTNSAAGHASAEAAQQAPAPRTHNVPEGVGRTAVSAAAQPQSKKEQTALSLQVWFRLRYHRSTHRVNQRDAGAPPQWSVHKKYSRRVGHTRQSAYLSYSSAKPGGVPRPTDAA
eukprot:gene1069-639_t